MKHFFGDKIQNKKIFAYLFAASLIVSFTYPSWRYLLSFFGADITIINAVTLLRNVQNAVGNDQRIVANSGLVQEVFTDRLGFRLTLDKITQPNTPSTGSTVFINTAKDDIITNENTNDMDMILGNGKIDFPPSSSVIITDAGTGFINLSKGNHDTLYTFSPGSTQFTVDAQCNAIPNINNTSILNVNADFSQINQTSGIVHYQCNQNDLITPATINISNTSTSSLSLGTSIVRNITNMALSLFRSGDFTVFSQNGGSADYTLNSSFQPIVVDASNNSNATISFANVIDTNIGSNLFSVERASDNSALLVQNAGDASYSFKEGPAQFRINSPVCDVTSVSPYTTGGISTYSGSLGYIQSNYTSFAGTMADIKLTLATLGIYLTQTGGDATYVCNGDLPDPVFIKITKDALATVNLETTGTGGLIDTFVVEGISDTDIKIVGSGGDVIITQNAGLADYAFDPTENTVSVAVTVDGTANISVQDTVDVQFTDSSIAVTIHTGAIATNSSGEIITGTIAVESGIITTYPEDQLTDFTTEVIKQNDFIIFEQTQGQGEYILQDTLQPTTFDISSSTVADIALAGAVSISVDQSTPTSISFINMTGGTLGLHQPKGDASYNFTKTTNQNYIMFNDLAKVDVIGTRFDVKIIPGAEIYDLWEGILTIRSACDFVTVAAKNRIIIHNDCSIEITPLDLPAPPIIGGQVLPDYTPTTYSTPTSTVTPSPPHAPAGPVRGNTPVSIIQQNEITNQQTNTEKQRKIDEMKQKINKFKKKEKERTRPYKILHTYLDVTKNEWFAPYVYNLVARGVLATEGKEYFRPKEEINRAEATKITLLANDIRPLFLEEIIFPDVASGEWFDPYISAGFHAGIIQGYPDGKFWPKKEITRAEALKIILKANYISPLYISDSSFTDVGRGEWFDKYVYAAHSLGVINGYPDGTFQPHKLITRAEFVKIAVAVEQVSQ